MKYQGDILDFRGACETPLESRPGVRPHREKDGEVHQVNRNRTAALLADGGVPASRCADPFWTIPTRRDRDEQAAVRDVRRGICGGECLRFRRDERRGAGEEGRGEEGRGEEGRAEEGRPEEDRGEEGRPEEGRSEEVTRRFPTEAGRKPCLFHL